MSILIIIVTSDQCNEMCPCLKFILKSFNDPELLNSSVYGKTFTYLHQQAEYTRKKISDSDHF